jgi:hypothetical protein
MELSFSRLKRISRLMVGKRSVFLTTHKIQVFTLKGPNTQFFNFFKPLPNKYARITGTRYHALLIGLGGGLTNFFVWLVLNPNPPNLHHLSNWDYKHEPPHSALTFFTTSNLLWYLSIVFLFKLYFQFLEILFQQQFVFSRLFFLYYLDFFISEY